MIWANGILKMRKTDGGERGEEGEKKTETDHKNIAISNGCQFPWYNYYPNASVNFRVPASKIAEYLTIISSTSTIWSQFWGPLLFFSQYFLYFDTAHKFRISSLLGSMWWLLIMLCLKTLTVGRQVPWLSLKAKSLCCKVKGNVKCA